MQILIKNVITVLSIILLTGLAQAGPRIIAVTAEKPQEHIFVKTSHLGGGFYAFSIRVAIEHHDGFNAYLVLRNEKGNLLSTPMLRSQMEDGTMRVYAAVHVDLLPWAQIDLRQSMSLYQLQLESFKNAFEKK